MKLIPGEYYHVALAEDRQRILQRGIDWSERRVNLWDECGKYKAGLPEYGSDEWPEGNYVWKRFEDAVRYANDWTSCSYVENAKPSGMDIWGVDARDLELNIDPQIVNSFYSDDTIEPERIRLVATVTVAGLCQHRGKEPKP